MSNPASDKLQQRERLFDLLYYMADEILKIHNPCKFTDGICTIGWKHGCCGSNSDHHRKSQRFPERYICRFLDEDKGCTIQAFGCRTFLCGSDKVSNKREAEARDYGWLQGYLMALRKVAEAYNIDVACFMTKIQAITRQ